MHGDRTNWFRFFEFNVASAGMSKLWKRCAGDTRISPSKLLPVKRITAVARCALPDPLSRPPAPFGARVSGTGRVMFFLRTCFEIVAADVRRRIFSGKWPKCPPPYVGGYDSEEFRCDAPGPA